MSHETMRSGRMAVLDPEGKVVGIENIYVADSSTANTNIPTIMFAKKLRDAICEIKSRGCITNPATHIILYDE